MFRRSLGVVCAAVLFVFLIQFTYNKNNKIAPQSTLKDDVREVHETKLHEEKVLPAGVPNAPVANGIVQKEVSTPSKDQIEDK